MNNAFFERGVALHLEQTLLFDGLFMPVLEIQALPDGELEARLARVNIVSAQIAHLSKKTPSDMIGSMRVEACLRAEAIVRAIDEIGLQNG